VELYLPTYAIQEDVKFRASLVRMLTHYVVKNITPLTPIKSMKLIDAGLIRTLKRLKNIADVWLLKEKLRRKTTDIVHIQINRCLIYMEQIVISARHL